MTPLSNDHSLRSHRMRRFYKESSTNTQEFTTSTVTIWDIKIDPGGSLTVFHGIIPTQTYNGDAPSRAMLIHDAIDMFHKIGIRWTITLVPAYFVMTSSMNFIHSKA